MKYRAIALAMAKGAADQETGNVIKMYILTYFRYNYSFGKGCDIPESMRNSLRPTDMDPGLD